MITLLIFLGVAFILVIEAVSLWGNTRQLKVEFDLDTTLVEPGELATLYYTVSNPHRLPILYVGFSLYFDSDVTVCEDKVLQTPRQHRQYGHERTPSLFSAAAQKVQRKSTFFAK